MFEVPEEDYKIVISNNAYCTAIGLQIEIHTVEAGNRNNTNICASIYILKSEQFCLITIFD